MTTKNLILEAFNNDINSQGLYWRISRPNTFVDLLMIEASKSSTNGINVDLALNVILISLKAIINNKYGIIDYRLSFNDIDDKLSLEKNIILTDINQILINHINKSNNIENNFFDELNYFKVLNNLKIDNYSVQIFEDLLDSFISYIKSNL